MCYITTTTTGYHGYHGTPVLEVPNYRGLVLMYNTSFQQSLDDHSTSLHDTDIDEVDEDVQAEG